MVNETLYATDSVKAMTVSQASDQRRITELTALPEEAAATVEEVFCEGQTRSLLSCIELAWDVERRLKKNARLQARLSQSN